MKVDLARVRARREALRQPIRECVARARERGRCQWLSLRWREPARDLLSDFASAQAEDAFYWEEPSRDFSILAVGRAAVIEASGRNRFAEASRCSRELFADLELACLDAADRCDCAADARGPLLLGGFAFYDSVPDASSVWRGLGAGRLILPEVSIVCRGAAAWVTRSCAVGAKDRVDELLDRFCAELPDAPRQSPPKPTDEWGRDAGPEIRVRADRAHGQYLAQVSRALEAIEAGKLDKLVLARSLRVTADHGFDPESFLAALRSIYPSCTTLAVRAGEDLFVSATPEPLVALDADRVTTAALAGSAPRGRNPEEEQRLSARLQASEKERFEHEVVVRSIRRALDEACGQLAGPAQPRLLKLEGIQHLETPLRGQLRPERRQTTNVLDLVARLHPTPAVAGAPRSTALDWLERFEALERGWYAGPVGYLDAGGNGEFCVALRSALLRGRSARLFAGAGIVAGSDPACELAETRLKLRALLAPLTEI